jgi:hypothetical protein
MKKVLLLTVVGLAGLASCKTKCPAYSEVKPATQVASPVAATSQLPPSEQQ